MSYTPAFVFGDLKYHLALLPSGIFRRDTFEAISRDRVAVEITRMQEKMMMNPYRSEIDDYKEMEREALDKVIASVNAAYSK